MPESRLLSPPEVQARCPDVRLEGLRGGLWSPLEVIVDPRQVLDGLPVWLRGRYGVEFHPGDPVLSYEPPHVVAAKGSHTADRLVICTGTDFQAIFPAAFAGELLRPCKLQMLRLRPSAPFRLGPVVAGGLSLPHYAAFAGCPTLPEVRLRLRRTYPECHRYGIHVLAAQTAGGDLITGDSHEYSDRIEPFDKPEIDRLILTYLASLVALPVFEIASRWHGYYLLNRRGPYSVVHPLSQVMAVTGLGGAGMTLSFGLAERLTREFLGEA